MIFPSIILANQSFHILKATGKIYVLKPWDYYWGAVRTGQYLIRDSIIQMTEGSELMFQYQEINSQKERNLQFFFKDSKLFRLNPDSLKSTKNRQYYFASNPMDQEQDFLSFMQQPFVLKLTDAWNRVSALHYLRSKNINHDQISQYQSILKKYKSTVLEVKKKIQIILPYDMADYRTKHLPLNIWCFWNDSRIIPERSDKTQYFLYVWKPKEDRGQAKYYTFNKEFMISIPETGHWFFQVESADRIYASRPIMINISTGWKDQNGADKNLYEASFSPVPKDNSTIYTRKNSATVDFAWGHNSAKKLETHLYIRKLSDKFYRKISLTSGTATLTLSPGKWVWYADYTPDKTISSVGNQSISSPFFYFSIVQLQNTDDMVLRALNTNKEGVYYLPGSDSSDL